VALSNTTLGMLAAAVNSSILLISLPAVFRGIGLKALEPANIDYLLRAIIGYLIVTAVLVVAFGRLGDQFGRATHVQSRLCRLHRRFGGAQPDAGRRHRGGARSPAVRPGAP
jgi:MFS family permease